ncbi:hypothetical protein [Rhizobium mesoamericanum]|nr:hypothetical protein [Rhizobium mesoamericanum]
MRVGIGGRRFPLSAGLLRTGDKRDTTNLSDAEGKQCLLDPELLYNFR